MSTSQRLTAFLGIFQTLHKSNGYQKVIVSDSDSSQEGYYDSLYTMGATSAEVKLRFIGYLFSCKALTVSSVLGVLIHSAIPLCWNHAFHTLNTRLMNCGILQTLYVAQSLSISVHSGLPSASPKLASWGHWNLLYLFLQILTEFQYSYNWFDCSPLM